MSRTDAALQYRAALRAGIKYYNTQVSQSRNPYLPVLDDIVNETQVSGQQVLGIREIPLFLVVGTLTSGRKAAFAGNYMPILPDDSEFAGKWINLCTSQFDEGGIRDPIKCMEFMGRFYVIEGHKRVSVLKSVGASSITADVTRILPVWSDDPKIRAYYEFTKFYKLTELYQIQFSMPGMYDRLLKKLGKTWDEVWNHDDRSLLNSLWLKVSRVVDQRALQSLNGRNASDVMLECLEVYSENELLKADDAKLQKMISAILQDLKQDTQEGAEAHISTTPEVVDKSLVRQFLDDLSRPDALHIAFIYTASPETSEWAGVHEAGRQRMEEAFENQIHVKSYTASRETADEVMETAVREGAQVIFVTAPLLMAPARRIAALYPQLKVLVCALSVPYKGIRTYYARVYEAKFILGAIAGTLCRGEPIGCVAQYPIMGTPAAINAFALGARLTCPDARVLVEWSCMPGDPCQKLIDAGARLITSQPGTVQALKDGSGLFELRDGQFRSLAREVWNWGRMYQKIVRSILDGGWEHEDGSPSVNYWWGMNGGVINVKLDQDAPEGTHQLVGILRNGMVSGSIHPFLSRIKDQQGILRLDGEQWMTPIEIMQMNWLAENVSGILPTADDVLEMSRETTRLLAIPKAEKADLTKKD